MSREAVIRESRAVLAKHARTFRLASAFLPPATYDDVAVTYAFCRLVDDAVDEAPSRDLAEQNLETLRQELDGAIAPRPLLATFQEICSERQIPLDAVHELTVGVGSDLGRIRVTDDADFLRYCYRVAGTVGRMMIGLLDIKDPAAIPHAIDLGIGMQITNICRDVLEDAERDRVYLPETRLQAAGTRGEDLVSGQASGQAIQRVVADLLELADCYYQSADQGLRFISPVPRAAIATAARMYRGIGVKIRRHNFNVLRGRTVVGRIDKLRWILVGLGQATTARRARSPHNPKLHTHLTGLGGAHLPT